jgi:hypothetical protein
MSTHSYACCVNESQSLGARSTEIAAFCNLKSSELCY